MGHIQAALLAAALSASALSASVSAHAGTVQLITNGDFSAGFTGWSHATLLNQAGGSGDWYIDTVGTTTPVSGFGTSANGGSGNYALSDEPGASSHILYQSFTVDAGATSVMASFSMFVNDWSGTGPQNAGTLDFAAPGPNQHARVDILRVGADGFSVAAADIVATLLAPMVDAGAGPHDFTAYSFDITSAVGGGGTFVLRFADVANQWFMQTGVDNVSIVADVPEPASLALAGLALLGLAASRRAARG